MLESILRCRVALYAAAVLFAGFTGCSCESEKMSMVNPEGVYQSYSVTYHADVNKTEVTARFRFGGASGTNLEIDGAAKIVHSSCELKKAQLFGVHYVGNCAGHQADHVFEYTDTAGKLSKNTIQLVAIDFPGNMPAEISRAKGIQLAFAGAAVGQDEFVELVITQRALGGAGNPKADMEQSTSKTFQQRTVGATEVSVTANDLQAFGDGDATLALKRVRNHSPQNATSRGGHMSATYVAKERTTKLAK